MMNERLQLFGEADENTLKQMENCLAVEDDALGVLCADNHLGYSQPVGGAVAYAEHISPSGVGYDIGCGNKAVMTNLMMDDIRGDIPALMDEIFSRISFGVGRQNEEPVEHGVIDKIAAAPFMPQRALLETARQQLGTVGSGNHYVDLFEDTNDGRVWVGVHFGSRGFGWKTADGFLAIAQGHPFSGEERRAKGIKVNEGEMMSAPVVFHTDSDEGWAYIEAMRLAGEYAYAGRDVVVNKVLEILGASSTVEVHNHHNFAWRERHYGKDYWVIRKGCTPAFPDQRGFVGATMGEESVILAGADGIASKLAMYSTVHGAGRVMSRTQAAGKKGKVYQCTERDCDFSVRRHVYAEERAKRGLKEHERFSMCPDHPEGKMKKRFARIKDGEIDWPAALEQLRSDGIELRGAAADEAPGAYKRLDDVLKAQGSTIEVTHRLRPVGVAMAPENTYDPYKD